MLINCCIVDKFQKIFTNFQKAGKNVGVFRETIEIMKACLEINVSWSRAQVMKY